MVFDAKENIYGQANAMLVLNAYPKILLRAEPLFVLTAMNASQHMTDQVLLGVFSFVRGEIKENGLHWGVWFSYPK